LVFLTLKNFSYVWSLVFFIEKNKNFGLWSFLLIFFFK